MIYKPDLQNFLQEPLFTLYMDVISDTSNQYRVADNECHSFWVLNGINPLSCPGCRVCAVFAFLSERLVGYKAK